MQSSFESSLITLWNTGFFYSSFKGLPSCFFQWLPVESKLPHKAHTACWHPALLLNLCYSCVPTIPAPFPLCGSPSSRFQSTVYSSTNLLFFMSGTRCSVSSCSATSYHFKHEVQCFPPLGSCPLSPPCPPNQANLLCGPWMEPSKLSGKVSGCAFFPLTKSWALWGKKQ